MFVRNLYMCGKIIVQSKGMIKDSNKCLPAGGQERAGGRKWRLGVFKGTCNFLFLKLNSGYVSIPSRIFFKLYVCLSSFCAYDIF